MKMLSSNENFNGITLYWSVQPSQMRENEDKQFTLTSCNKLDRSNGNAFGVS